MIGFAILAFALLALVIIGGANVVTAVVAISQTVTETVASSAAPFASTGKNTIVNSGLDKTGQLSSASAAGTNITKVAYAQLALASGAATINLAAVPGLNGVAQDFTGLFIRSIMIRAKSDNANPITIAKGASNGFTGFGSAFSLTLNAGKQALIECNPTAVGSGVRTLDVSGTGAQVLEYQILAGDN